MARPGWIAAVYPAVLIDERHDFEPAWLGLAAQMVNPTCDSLLLLCDDAQSVYGHHRHSKMSLKCLGIKA